MDRILTVIMILFLCIAGYSATFYVPEDYSTIQAAIFIAQNADNIIVSPGTYYENIDYLGKAIRIASLYYTTGDTTYISQTIIDGSSQGSVVTISGENLLNVHLCGFTIQNGMTGYGGGVYCYYAQADLSYLVIRNNVASGSMAINMGGGIYCEDAAVEMDHLVIENNYGERGGGLYCIGSSPELNDVNFYNNVSDSGGGGVYVNNSSIEYYGGDIIGNYADYGGGLFTFNAEVYLSDVTFTGNTANWGAGAIYNDDEMEFDSENRCNIYLNNIENRYGGSEIESATEITVYVDTFTVMYPTGFHAYPLDNFTFDILNGIQQQVETDLYVSPAGDNNNSGEIPESPLKTIQYACSIILADEDNPLTIYLAPGTYSTSGTGEFFPVFLPPFVSLQGSGIEETVLNAESEGTVLKIFNSEISNVSAMRIINGSDYHVGGIKCLNSSVNLSDLEIMNCDSERGMGGVELSYGEYVLNNVTISNNQGYDSGGMSIAICSNVEMDSVIIENNYSVFNGGISSIGTNLVITNSIIQNNTASYCVGGIRLDNESNTIMENVEITGNQATGGYAGGIYTGTQNSLEMSNVTIAYNSSFEPGGGIYIADTQCEFDPVNRCNIYLNNTEGRSIGADIYCLFSIEIIVDTFTVMNPTDFHAMPIELYTFDILNCKHQQEASDLYVSPDGDNSNSGLTAEYPLRTIQRACSVIQSDSVDVHTIFLLPGTYSASNNGEFFPISLPDNVALSGLNQGTVILDGEDVNNVVRIYQSVNNTISNLKIINGNSSDGGGMYITRSSPVISDVTFQSNFANCNGGAIFVGEEAYPYFRSVRIQYNSSCFGGGIAILNGNATLEDVIVENNSAIRSGGGIVCNCNSDVQLHNISVSGNCASTDGGGIYCEESNLTISNSLFYDNVSYEKGGCIGIKTNSIVKITNTTFTRNSADSGSGIYSWNNSSLYIANSIFWDNNEEDIRFITTQNTDAFCIVYSDIEDGEESIIHSNICPFNVTEGNIDAYPEFVSPDNDDFQLQNDSPCIDAGIDYFEFNGIELVNLDETQFFGEAPDMGYFEKMSDGNGQQEISPASFEMKIFPNPFNPETTIEFGLAEAGEVKIEVYNVKGQKVDTVVDMEYSAGTQKVIWNAKGLASGIYYYKISSNGHSDTGRMVLLK
ncbi:MAG: T9SS type A sorting domain-containing protein [Candidatus Cloacimonetes bacterium]|nr:T9SS type A sorting domain-containing protein [Candidatus Cloacimonadota bacterium]